MSGWLEVDWTLAQFHHDQETARALYREFVLEGAQLRRVAPENVLTAVCASFSETPESLRESSRRMGRKAFAQLARDECRLTFRQIGALLHVSGEAAGQLAAAGHELERADLRYRVALAHARALALGGV